MKNFRKDMEKEVLDSYDRAKAISDEVMVFARQLVKEGEKALTIAEQIEEKIRQLGGKPAWPVNISINEIAAHYTPLPNDTLVLKTNDLVKVDIGVQVNGYIWDRAFTVSIGNKTHPLIEASDKALQEVLKLIKSGTKICEISEVVESMVASFGFNPIRNLSGHRLDRFEQHARPAIPNGRNNIQDELQEDWVVAMEVFTTDGVGWVKESKPVMIYRYARDKPVRLWEARKILDMAKKEFERLPFATRWLKGMASVKMDMALSQLLDIDALMGYPPLREEANGMVAVAEETVMVK